MLKNKVNQGPERAALRRVEVYLIWCVLAVWLTLNCTTGECSGSDVTQVDLSFWRGSSSRLTPNDDSTTRQDLQEKFIFYIKNYVSWLVYHSSHDVNNEESRNLTGIGNAWYKQSICKSNTESDRGHNCFRTCFFVFGQQLNNYYTH